jgi:5'-3' exonuclease
MDKKKKILILIDADTFPYLESKLESSGETDLSTYLNNTDDRINNIFKEVEKEYPDSIINYLGFLSERSFRHKYTSYKANRKGMKKPLFFYEMINHLKTNWGFFSEPLLEADDSCLIYQKYYKDKYDTVIIASVDKDLRQIEGIFFDFKWKRWFNVTEEVAEYNINIQLLMGDAVDGIAGIKGCGEKAAKWLLANNSNFTISDILNAYIDGFTWITENGKNKTVKGKEQLIGINEFTKTFNQIYMLRTIEEVKIITKEEITIKDPMKHELKIW